MVKSSTSTLLFKKLLRSVKDNYKQFIAIVIISFLSTCLFCGLTSNAKNLEKRVNYLNSETNFADGYISFSPSEDIPYDDLKNIEGVKTLEHRSYLSAKSESGSMNIITQDSSNQLSQGLITSGEFGFLIMDSFSKKSGLNIGDTLEIEVKNYFLSNVDETILSYLSSLVKESGNNVLSNNNLKLKIKITGTMKHSEGVQSSQFSSTIALTNYSYIANSITELISQNYLIENMDSILLVNHLANSTFDFVESFLKKLDNQILIKVDDSYKTNDIVTNISNRLSSYTKVYIATTSDNLESSLAINQDIDQAEKLTYVFPLIFFLVCVLVILTTLSQMIIREKLQIGALKAIGVPKYKIYFHYISYGFILCLLGGVLGFFIGPLIIPRVMNLKYNLLWDIPSLKTSFFHVSSIIILFVLLFLSCLVSFLVSYKEIQKKPVDSLRNSVPQIKIKAKKNNRSRLSLTTRMSIRNIFSNKVKSLMVIIGTLGCSALLVCGFGIMDTLNYGISDSYENQLVRDITISINDNDLSQIESIKHMEEIKKIEEVYVLPLEISNDSLSKTSTITYIEKDSSCCHLPIKENYLSIDKTSAKDLKVNVGDKVKLNINGELVEKEIAYIFSSSLNRGLFTYQDEEMNMTPSSLWITLNDQKDAKKVKEQIENNYNFTLVMTKDDLYTRANDLLGSIKIMTNVVKVFAICLAVVVIYNLTSLNIVERSRDIATLKVLGFSFNEIRKTIITEIFLDTLIGTFIGLFFGFPMCYLVLSINKTTLLTFLYHIYWYSYVISFFISIITSIIVNLFLCRRINKIKMVESLKSVE